MKSTLVISSFALAAAAALAFGAPVAHAQSAASGETPVAHAKQASSDTWITTKVKTELVTTAGVPSGDVSVDTAGGVVTLTGVLASKVEVKKAVAAAESVKGVKRVDASGLKVK